jgi:hypothetical protein
MPGEVFVQPVGLTPFSTDRSQILNVAKFC